MNNMNHHRDATSETNNKEKLFHRSESMPHVTQRIVEMLDLIEQRVELLRDHASAMENERDTLLSMLSSIKSHKDLQLASEGEREEIELFADRLLNRTLTVEVSVTTPRNEMQQLALNHVNQYLDELLKELEANCENGKETLQSYMNACLSECKGPVHQKFQAAVLECTAYDQKQTRKKLESLMASFGTQKFNK